MIQIHVISGLAALAVVATSLGCRAQAPPQPAWPAADGDIILHQSTSRQSAAISAATGSPWTHIGMVFEHEGSWQVLEAVEPVRWTPLQQWVERGRNRDIVVVRLANSSGLPEGWQENLETAATAYLGRHYDLLFDWSDDTIYCSELVYKAYETATGLGVAEQVHFANLNMSDPMVQALVEERAGAGFDATAPVVTPDAFLTSPQLAVVYSTDPTFFAVTQE
jgi:hypothetical protein